MKLRGRRISGREKDEASVRLLEEQREKLHYGDMSTARCAAHNLSWMQEDGFEILREALFGDGTLRTKLAAAYGLRNMHGRMKKLAMQVFKQGLLYPNSITREVCKKALLLATEKTTAKSVPATVRIDNVGISRKIPSKSNIGTESTYSANGGTKNGTNKDNKKVGMDGSKVC